MKTEPIVPTTLQRDAQGTPYSAEYGDVYHPHVGALPQARHVFIAGNGLPSRWRERDTFVVLETGFGLGNNFLATWQAWRDDEHHCERLVFVSIERHPLRAADLRAAHEAHAGTPVDALSAQLAAAWPPLTPNLHRLEFEGGRVQLYLALGDVQDWLPELRMQADAFFLDGFTPARNPRMWDRRVCTALGRLAATGATLATWSAASALRADLASAGFDVRLASGIGGKRDITLATYAPRYTTAPASPIPKPDERRALIIGAGLAGCSTAWALAEQGWTSRVIERRSHVAAEASGNPGGLFHGIVTADDGPHARLHRAASFEAARAVQYAIEVEGAAGATGGFLRMEHKLTADRMREMLAALGLPPDYVEALDAQAAGERAGLPLRAPAWHYPSGGWVDPVGLAASFMARTRGAAVLDTGIEVASLRRDGERWVALDADGAVIDTAPVVVLANGLAAARLMPAGMPTLRSVRGQLSWLEAAPASTHTRIPIADAGYLLPPSRGRIVFGATSTEGDTDNSVRIEDHAANLAKLERLLGHPINAEPSMLAGRTAWRCVTQDKLPLIGAVPALDSDAWRDSARRDQVRYVPRIPGLFVYTALGSRGITWSALGARVVAAAVTGGVAPLEASLLDAVDPARFAVRAARRGSDAPAQED